MFIPTHNAIATARLEAHWQSIRDECLALPHAEFTAWPEQAIYNHGWDVYGLYANARMLRENCVFCPNSTSVLDGLQGLVNAGFSRMAPGTRILPHVGYTRSVVRLHLALQVDGDCGLRVGTEQRTWREGQCLLFDDTLEHEAWNNGTRDRLVLLLDLARTAMEGAVS